MDTNAAPVRARRATLLLVALAASTFAAPAPAQIPSRNVQVLANRNDYPPIPSAPFGAGYSACWSYLHGDGREYAVIGTLYGTAIYNVTDPVNPVSVGFIPGPYSTWREMKSYRNWIYVVTESNDVPSPGLQIIRMTDPDHPVLAATYTTNFQTSHTVSVDSTRAILYCNGTRSWSGSAGYASGMRILSIANPEAPVELGWWPGGAIPVAGELYVHDCVPIGARLYASNIYGRYQRIFDVTNPAVPTQIAAWTYPGAYYTHSAWPDASGNFVYVCDEQNGQALRVFDISNLASPKLDYDFTPNPQAIVHNPVVVGNELFLASYTEGTRFLDISDPAHPAEYGWADTYPGTSGGYAGVWGICPMFPSGTVIGSDMQTGLWVMRPVRNYGLVKVDVVDARDWTKPMAGVTVNMTTTGDSLTTGADGVAQFAPIPGVHTVAVNKFGYEPVSAVVSVAPGGHAAVVLTLNPKPVVSLGGQVTAGGTPLSDAEISLAYTPVRAVSDATGAYLLTGVPEGYYQIEARRAGYVPQVGSTYVGAGSPPTRDYALQAANSWDDLETDAGWVVGGAGTGDDATAGFWERGAPVGTGAVGPSMLGCPCGCQSAKGAALAAVQPHGGSICGMPAGASMAAAKSGMSCCNHDEAQSAPTSCALTGLASVGGAPGCVEVSVAPEGIATAGAAVPAGGEGRPVAFAAPGSVQPATDHSPPPGTQCFFTGQATPTSLPDDNDVDGGKTSLTSPAMNLTSISDPVIGYWRWFYTNGGDNQDWFAVSISNDNGVTWTPVDTTRGMHNDWEERAIRVGSYVTPTTQVKVRFVAADYGAPSIVEAAIDDIATYPWAATLVGTGPGSLPSRLAFRTPWPNPAHGPVRLTLELPRGGATRVELLDLSGRRIRTLYDGLAGAGSLDLDWDGRDEGGRTTASGVYYARATFAGEHANVRFARLQ